MEIKPLERNGNELRIITAKGEIFIGAKGQCCKKSWVVLKIKEGLLLKKEKGKKKEQQIRKEKKTRKNKDKRKKIEIVP